MKTVHVCIHLLLATAIRTQGSIHDTTDTPKTACQAKAQLKAMATKLEGAVKTQSEQIAAALPKFLQLYAAASTEVLTGTQKLMLLLPAAAAKLQAASNNLQKYQATILEASRALTELAGVQQMVAEAGAREISGKDAATAATWIGAAGMQKKLKDLSGAQPECATGAPHLGAAKQPKAAVHGTYPITVIHLQAADNIAAGENGNGPRICGHSSTSPAQTCQADAQTSVANLLLTPGKLTKPLPTNYQPPSASEKAYKAQPKRTTGLMPPQKTVENLLSNLHTAETAAATLIFKASDIDPAQLISDTETEQALLQILKPGEKRSKIGDYTEQINKLKKKLYATDQSDHGEKLNKALELTKTTAESSSEHKTDALNAVTDFTQLAASTTHNMLAATKKVHQRRTSIAAMKKNRTNAKAIVNGIKKRESANPKVEKRKLKHGIMEKQTQTPQEAILLSLTRPLFGLHFRFCHNTFRLFF
uniref:Variant surface glycoprotein 1125.1803 n=1 Tax=Trypanosoma brucei TaxID=5691 RepID=A0A1J0R7W7_9TRYP|nr:variant surface glycoprotein 1125.1803 [Trypanosoma brucei]